MSRKYIDERMYMSRMKKQLFVLLKIFPQLCAAFYTLLVPRIIFVTFYIMLSSHLLISMSFPAAVVSCLLPTKHAV